MPLADDAIDIDDIDTSDEPLLEDWGDAMSFTTHLSTGLRVPLRAGGEAEARPERCLHRLCAPHIWNCNHQHTFVVCNYGFQAVAIKRWAV